MLRLRNVSNSLSLTILIDPLSIKNSKGEIRKVLIASIINSSFSVMISKLSVRISKSLSEKNVKILFCFQKLRILHFCFQIFL
jgi:hypothetical protein